MNSVTVVDHSDGQEGMKFQSLLQSTLPGATVTPVFSAQTGRKCQHGHDHHDLQIVWWTRSGAKSKNFVKCCVLVKCLHVFLEFNLVTGVSLCHQWELNRQDDEFSGNRTILPTPADTKCSVFAAEPSSLFLYLRMEHSLNETSQTENGPRVWVWVCVVCVCGVCVCVSTCGWNFLCSDKNGKSRVAKFLTFEFYENLEFAGENSAIRSCFQSQDTSLRTMYESLNTCVDKFFVVLNKAVFSFWPVQRVKIDDA